MPPSRPAPFGPAQVLALAAALTLAACETPKPQPEPVAPPPPRIAAPVAPPPPAEPDRPGLTLPDFQKEIALAIVRTSGQETFTGRPPPLLRSVIVLQISIDHLGMPSRVTLFRSNGFAELEKTAIAAVYRAAPYPIPGRSLLAGYSSVTFTESFLFRNDGRFQVRTVAEQQMGEVEPRSRQSHAPDCCNPSTPKK